MCATLARPLIRRILLAVDGSDHAWAACRCACELARAYGARLKVISVVDTRVLHEEPSLRHIGLRQEPSLSVSDHAGWLREVQRHALDSGVDAQAGWERGDPGEMICRSGCVFDLIALGRHGNRSPMERLMTGSVVEKVMSRASRPVLIAPETHAEIARILAAYDGTRGGEAVVHWAADVARTMKVPLDIVHVCRNYEAGLMVLGQARGVSKHWPPGDTIVRDGAVADQILLTAAERRARLVVIGAHRVGQPSLGSVAEALFYRRMEAPLVIVR